MGRKRNQNITPKERKRRQDQFERFYLQNGHGVQCWACGGWFLEWRVVCKHCGRVNEDYKSKQHYLNW